MKKDKFSTRIEANPKVAFNKPVIKGTRISVDFILELLSSGWTYDQIIDDYGITKQDILASLEYASETLKDIQSVSLDSLNK